MLIFTRLQENRVERNYKAMIVTIILIRISDMVQHSLVLLRFNNALRSAYRVERQCVVHIIAPFLCTPFSYKKCDQIYWLRT